MAAKNITATLSTPDTPALSLNSFCSFSVHPINGTFWWPMCFCTCYSPVGISLTPISTYQNISHISKSISNALSIFPIPPTWRWLLSHFVVTSPYRTLFAVFYGINPTHTTVYSTGWASWICCMLDHQLLKRSTWNLLIFVSSAVPGT